MFVMEKENKVDYLTRILEQMDALITELRLECLDMAKHHDEAESRIEDLEADMLDLSEKADSLEMALYNAEKELRRKKGDIPERIIK